VYSRGQEQRSIQQAIGIYPDSIRHQWACLLSMTLLWKMAALYLKFLAKSFSFQVNKK